MRDCMAFFMGQTFSSGRLLCAQVICKQENSCLSLIDGTPNFAIHVNHTFHHHHARLANSGVGYLQSQWAAQLPDEVWVAHSLGFIATAHLPADPERRATLGNLR